ncbi:hypothetical protein D3C76_795210 [compost metagenome]
MQLRRRTSIAIHLFGELIAVVLLHHRETRQQKAIAVSLYGRQALDVLLRGFVGIRLLALEAMGADDPEIPPVRGIGQALDVDLGVWIGYGQAQVFHEREGVMLIAHHSLAGCCGLDGQAFQAGGFVVGQPQRVADLQGNRKAVTQ